MQAEQGEQVVARGPGLGSLDGEGVAEGRRGHRLGNAGGPADALDHQVDSRRAMGDDRVTRAPGSRIPVQHGREIVVGGDPALLPLPAPVGIEDVDHGPGRIGQVDVIVA